MKPPRAGMSPLFFSSDDGLMHWQAACRDCPLLSRESRDSSPTTIGTRTKPSQESKDQKGGMNDSIPVAMVIAAVIGLLGRGQGANRRGRRLNTPANPWFSTSPRPLPAAICFFPPPTHSTANLEPHLAKVGISAALMAGFFTESGAEAGDTVFRRWRPSSNNAEHEAVDKLQRRNVPAVVKGTGEAPRAAG